MGLVQVGWVVPGANEPEEYLVEMTDVQSREVENVLKQRYQNGVLAEYWMADAIIFPFRKFTKRVLKPEANHRIGE